MSPPDLNPPQQEAVGHDSGPLLVLAGAGSGKTRVITYKIARLIFDLGVPPSRIMALTFTNKAAREMKERVEKIAGGRTHGLWIGTFHSICARILRIERLHDGLFTIYDTDDQERLLKTVLTELGLADSRRFSVNELRARISALKNKMIRPAAFLASVHNLFDEQFGKIYAAYESALTRSKALDFDDLLVKTVDLFREREGVLDRWRDRILHLLVDEYQDTNGVQYEFVRLLSSLHRNITVVGDDDQSIYSWRGADLRNILEFEKSFPDAHVVRLEQNYRSTKTILAAANAVIRNNKSRKVKTLFTEGTQGDLVEVVRVPDDREEALEIVRRVKGGFLRSTAVFYRTNAQSRTLEDMFRNAGLPYVIVGGLRFYERMEIKDILAYLRLLANPSDVISLTRIINMPRRGIGEKTLAKFLAFAKESGLPVVDALAELHRLPDLTARETATLASFAGLVKSLAGSRATLPLEEFVRTVLDRTSYLAMWQDSEEEGADERVNNLGEFLNAVSEYMEHSPEPSLEGFLEEVALITDLDGLKEETGNVVTLMTLHASKGLEFDRVFIAGLEEGLFPIVRDNADSEVEEERRLFYVGITRARKRLALFHTVVRRRFGTVTPSLPSSFLNELPEECLTVTDCAPAHREPAFPTARREERETPRRYAREAESQAMPDYEKFPQEGGEAAYRKGMRVIHPLWGQGTILSVSGFQENMKAEVRFDNASVKRLVLKYAKLEPVP